MPLSSLIDDGSFAVREETQRTQEKILTQALKLIEAKPAPADQCPRCIGLGRDVDSEYIACTCPRCGGSGTLGDPDQQGYGDCSTRGCCGDGPLFRVQRTLVCGACFDAEMES